MLSDEAKALIGRMLAGENLTDTVEAPEAVWEEARAAFPVPAMADCAFCADPTPVGLTHCQTCGVYLRTAETVARDTRILWGGVTFGDVAEAMRPGRP